jgi:hypothetical protein
MFILGETTFWTWFANNPIPLSFGAMFVLAGLVLILGGFGIVNLRNWFDIKPGWKTVAVGFIFLPIGIILLNIEPGSINNESLPRTSTPASSRTTSTPPTHLPIPTDRVQIIEPTNNTSFDNKDKEIPVKVNIPSKQENEHLWIVVNPARTNHWYPQCDIDDPKSVKKIGENTFLYNNLSIENQEGEHYIHIISANDNANRAFKNYLSKVDQTGNWTEEPLPAGASSLTKVKITVE